MKQIATAKYYTDKLVAFTRENGFRSSAALLGKNIIWPFCEWLIRRRIRAHERFDLKYGVDTQTPILIRHLETSAPGAEYANPYEGAAIPLVHRILHQLKIDLRRFTFVDLGSGKGRVLLIAAQYPFKSVIGVEFSETLHRIALSNIARFCSYGVTRTRPTSVNMDAAAFDFSQLRNKIVFCNNPFKADLMINVLERLRRSLAETSDEGILIYLTPIPPQIKKRLDIYEIVGQGRYLSHFGGAAYPFGSGPSRDGTQRNEIA